MICCDYLRDVWGSLDPIENILHVSPSDTCGMRAKDIVVVIVVVVVVVISIKISSDVAWISDSIA